MSMYAQPVKVGTIGTVGSLVRWEIEYFSQLELHDKVEQASGRGTCFNNRPGFCCLLMTWGRKKRRHRQNKRLAPSICSVVKVTENVIPYFNNTILTD
ncbi:hypothetical protein QQ045_013704 [Rhodiola kirilowii]